MPKLIKTWQELAEVPANDKYRIIVDPLLFGGWIVPVTDEPIGDRDDFVCHCEEEKSMSVDEYYKHHVYLSTHTFYGSNYKRSTKIFQEHGFDIEIDNWNKGEN